MPLAKYLTFNFRSPYEQFNKKRNILFEDRQVQSAEEIEENLRNELSYTLNEDPETAQNILMNALKGEKLSPSHQQALSTAGLGQEDLKAFIQDNKLESKGQQTAAAAASTIASFAVASTFRLVGNAAANQAVTSGKVVQYEAQQRTLTNIKQASGIAGTAAGLVAGIVTANPLLIVGSIVAGASQAVGYYIQNDRISAKQERQDLNAEYYQQAFGNIVRRGNR